MPYDGEFAAYNSLKRLAESERIKSLLSKYSVLERPIGEGSGLPLEIESITPSDWKPDYILSIDGSSLPHRIRNGYPGAEVGYITISAVFINAAKQRELDEQRPVNPIDFRNTQDASSIDEVIPGSNIVFSGNISAKVSMRQALMELMREAKSKLPESEESLLDTYEVLLAYKPQNTSNRQKCPYEAEGACGSEDSEPLYEQHNGAYICSCKYHLPLFSTDALRIHEGMVPEGSNMTVYTETMQVLERIFLIHILRWIEKHAASSFKKLAIVIDGPLAVFGHPAWLSQAIYLELRRINDKIKDITGNDILLIGVEKTGTFVDHFEHIDTKQDGSTGAFPNQSVALITDQYIRERIVFSSNTSSRKFYGEDTYFGRKIFYKTKSGAKIVAVIPFYNEDDKDLSRAEIIQHPRLMDVMSLLDQVISSRFKNAVAPLLEAHKEAAIPLNLGTKVLERLAKELLKQK